MITIKMAIRQATRAMPVRVRQFLARFGSLRRLRQSVFQADTSLHDSYYTEEYYERDAASPALMSAPVICRDMVRLYQPKDVIDVGCGTGAYLEVFRSLGIPGHGVELATAALRQCKDKGLSVIRGDLSTLRELPWKADVVYSIEVAEHIAEPGALSFVRLLSKAARKAVVVTAALPGQEGLCHNNCQPKDYWIELFADQGLVYDHDLTSRWQTENRARKLPPWFWRNLMAFNVDTGSKERKANGGAA